MKTIGKTRLRAVTPAAPLGALDAPGALPGPAARLIGTAISFSPLGDAQEYEGEDEGDDRQGERDRRRVVEVVVLERLGVGVVIGRHGRIDAGQPTLVEYGELIEQL